MTEETLLVKESTTDNDDTDQVLIDKIDSSLGLTESESSETRSSLCFLRTSDLMNLCGSLKATPVDELQEHGVISEELHKEEKKKHPTVDERWIALDESSPENVKLVVEELVRYALTLPNLDVWNPERKTAKLISQGAKVTDDTVWMWIGNVPHSGYGSDIPCVKSSGLVNMSPKALAELLLDSNKVKEYNRSSHGRTDRFVWQDNVDTEEGEYGKGETKVTRSINKAPLIRRLLEFVCLMHGERLDDGSYLVVARTVSGPIADSDDHPTVINEVLLNVHFLKTVEGNPNQTEMININHLKSPVVPMMVAKKVGLASASSFINDIRSLS